MPMNVPMNVMFILRIRVAINSVMVSYNIFSKFFRIYSGWQCSQEFSINTFYIQQKTYKKYHHNRGNTMTKIIVTHVSNINETFMCIFVWMPAGVFSLSPWLIRDENKQDISR